MCAAVQKRESHVWVSDGAGVFVVPQVDVRNVNNKDRCASFHCSHRLRKRVHVRDLALHAFGLESFRRGDACPCAGQLQ